MPTSVQAAPSRLTLAARDIKLAHSVFALPFAILGAALAADFSQSPVHLALQLVLIVLCMVAARTWAMLVNRLADARIDAKNPRTTLGHPNGTPVCPMPHGPGFIPTNTASTSPAPPGP